MAVTLINIWLDIHSLDKPPGKSMLIRVGSRQGERVVQSTPGGRRRSIYLLVVFSLLLLGGATFAIKAYHDIYYPSDSMMTRALSGGRSRM